jgi:uracil-DNA glycosylase family 4
MGFFSFVEPKRPRRDTGRISVETLHAAGCKACPLASLHCDLHNPDMPATGCENPQVYLLGEAPGEKEDRQGRQLVGKAGRLLRSYMPPEWHSKVRWNNCVRTRPKEGDGNRTPTQVEIECCRPSVIADIEKTKPEAIFGFGGVPLRWALDMTGITKWCGRMVPIKVGSHTCWFFPMLHPSYLARKATERGFRSKGYGSDEEFQFALDMKRAFAAVKAGLPKPIVHTKETALEGIEVECKDARRIVAFLRSLYEEKAVGLDYETNKKRPYAAGAKILTVALSTGARTLAFPIDHSGATWNHEERELIMRELKLFFHKAKCRKISHFLNFEQEWSAFWFGKEILHGTKWGDTASQAYLLDERMKMGKPDALSLEFLIMQYFGLNVKALSGDLDKNNLDKYPVEHVCRYNGLDAKYHRLLWTKQRKRLEEEGLSDLYRMHYPRIPTLVLTQLKGVPVDPKAVALFDRRYARRREKAEASLARLPSIKKFERRFGHSFNPAASKDVLDFFRQIVGVPLDNADEKAIAKIKHPVARLIIRWRKANKLHSTYVKPLMPGSPHLYPDGMVHPIISTTTTRTWRTSSEDPNIQNFPKRQTKEVRSQIAAKPGYKVVSFDYGQIQARNVGMESLDAALLKAFWEDYDIHADWTWRIIDKYPEWVPGGRRALKEDKDLFKAKRGDTKNQMVFPSFFGARAKKIASELGIPLDIAEECLDEFWEMFPDIKGWHERIEKFYWKHGYVTGCTGFRRRAPISPNELINAPIQADEAAIVLDAMIRLSKIDHDLLQASMEIHDDLTFIWEEKRIDELAEIVVREMLACPFEWANVVPIVVEMSVGQNWADKATDGLANGGVFRSDKWTGAIRG